MLTSALLFAFQVVVANTDSIYSSPALATLVEMSSRTNRHVPRGMVGYGATIESELSLLVNTTGGPDGAVAGTAAATTEAAAQVEQLRIHVEWDRTGTFQQQVVGYRARQLGPMFSALSIVPRPWTAPTLYGNRMSLVFGGPPSFRESDSTRRQMPTVHPFAEDREEYYRFSGGDTVAIIHAGSRDLRVVRILVEPRVRRPGVMLFAGEVLVDGATGQIIRMRGRIRLGAPAGVSPLSRMVRLVGQVQEVAYIDFENSEHEGRFWLPRRQRLEYQVMTGLTEARATIRVQSYWRDIRVDLREDAGIAADDSLGAPHYSFTFMPQDSTSRFPEWRSDLGAMTADASARDFDDVAPPEFRADGPPQWRWQARGFSDVLRLNRVEGLFVGVAGLLDFRQAAPGVALRVFGGRAFSADDMKGGLEVARVRGPWVSSVRGERQLASTNDFSPSLGGGSGNVVGALFGREDYDWVDRRVLSFGVIREIGAKHSSAVRAEVADVSDHGFTHELSSGPLGGRFRPNRPVNPGRYVRSRLQLEFGRNIVTSPLVSGLGATMVYEHANGTLSWQRAQLQALARRTFGRVVLTAGTDVAIVRSAEIPAQQLLEIGGAEGLPGYAYKAFAGDQAVIARTTVAYLLPVWEAPVHVGRVVLPAIAPQLQVGMFGGRTSATHQTVPVLDRLAWATTNGWRGTLDARLRFAGAFSVGASRAIDRRDRWKATINLGSWP